MIYAKGALSAVAAIIIAESAFWWPFLKESKASGISVVPFLLAESLLSPKFWIIAILSFGLFFVASRANTILRVLFFWIPTVTVSTLGLAVVGVYTYLYFFVLSKAPQIH